MRPARLAAPQGSSCRCRVRTHAVRADLAPLAPLSRRHLLHGCATLPLILGTQHAAHAAPAIKPLADLPMLRLKLPSGGLGRDYAVLQLTVGGRGPYRFMVDSGLTAELVTPHLRQELAIQGAGQLVSGLGAGGAAAPATLVELRGAALCCGEFPASPEAKQLPLPPLTAAVLDFPQAHMDPNLDPVEGMLGMEVLSLFDTDLDFPAGRIRLWSPGSAAQVASDAGLVEIPAAVLNETGVIGIRAQGWPGGAAPKEQQQQAQPFVGIVDCGASFSAVNIEAAKLMGVPLGPGGKPSNPSGPGVTTLGIDGKPQTYPTAQLSFTFVGDATKGPDNKLSFAAPPAAWQPWQPVTAAVGDLPVFGQLLANPGAGKPFKGPAALIGLDVLAQRRLILGAAPEKGAQGRRRQLFVGTGA